MKILGTDHISLAVRSLEGRLELWENLLGVKSSAIEDLPERGVRAARIETPGGPALELVAPLGEESPIAGFLETRGEGIHHLCLEVEDIDRAAAELKSAGFQIIGEHPVPGARGTRVFFVHPRSCGGVLLEFMARAGSRPQA